MSPPPSRASRLAHLVDPLGWTFIVAAAIACIAHHLGYPVPVFGA